MSVPVLLISVTPDRRVEVVEIDGTWAPDAARPSPMRVIVAGSRTIRDRELVRSQMNAAWRDWGRFEVVSGMAAGPDRIAADLAEAAGVRVVRMPADWERHGRRAGCLRNVEMVKSADAALVIYDGSSPGSAHLIREASAAGLRVRVASPAGWWSRVVDRAPSGWDPRSLNGVEWVPVDLGRPEVAAAEPAVASAAAR